MTLLLVVDILSNNGFAQPTDLSDRTVDEKAHEVASLNEIPHIDVGASPIAILATYGEIYVANEGSGTVSVISTENNTKIKDIPVGDGPRDIAIAYVPDIADNEEADNLGRVYVANNDSNTVSVINATDNTKIKDIPVGDGPRDIAIAYNEYTSDTVYVANWGSNTVSVINATDNTKIGEDIPVGDKPIAIAIADIADNDEADNLTVYVANEGSDTVSVISTESNTKIVEDILVGNRPRAIAWDGASDTVYVANYLSGTVSVISTESNTKIVEDILVEEGPIAIDDGTGEVYVANFLSRSVSVISTENNTKIVEDIPVGESPEDIARVIGDTLAVFVANLHSNTVSVINAKDYTKIGEDIPVGESPEAIAYDDASDTVYVANRESNSISVIEPDAGKVVAGVTFHVNPFGSGYILCEGMTRPSPTEQSVYVYSGDECKATPNEGFEFASWEQNLEDNSTQLISVAGPSSPLESFLESYRQYRQDESADKPKATLDVTKFGTFTANFREAPPPLPPEFWVQMYAVIGTVVTALFIPSIVGWFKSKRDSNKLNYFHKQVAALYQDGKLDENDIEGLDHLQNRIGDTYSEGKINEKHYESLRSEISTLYEEIFRKKIIALNDINDAAGKKTRQEQLAQIRNEIKYAFSKGRLNDKHYALLNEDISKLDGKESRSSS